MSGAIDLRYLIAATSDLPGGEDWLSPGEQRALARLRFPKRREDFLLGRWAAKQAVLLCAGGGLSTAEVAIVAAEDGAPEVFFGERPAPLGLSISHSGGRALAVVGPREAMFGADLESVELRSAGLARDFFTTSEQDWVSRLPDGERDLAVSLVWSAKEAVLKALRTGLREDTRAVEIGAPAPARWRLFCAPGTSGGLPLVAGVPGRGLALCGQARRTEGQVMTVMARGESELVRLGAVP